MGTEIFRRQDISLTWFTAAFVSTIFLFKLSSFLAQFNLYFHWSDLFDEQSDNYSLWFSLAVRFLIPASVGLIGGVLLPINMRSSVVFGVIFSSLFLVWPAILDFDRIVDPNLLSYKGIFFIFYSLYLIFFPLAAYGGFSLGVALGPFMPKFALVPGERVNISLGRHILLPMAIAISGNLISSTVLRDFALRVLGANSN